MAFKFVKMAHSFVSEVGEALIFHLGRYNTSPFLHDCDVQGKSSYKKILEL
jgi:hypothetical protein